MAIQKKSLIKNRETTKKAIIAKGSEVSSTPVSSTKAPVLEGKHSLQRGSGALQRGSGALQRGSGVLQRGNNFKRNIF